jgi:hypothetical protein
LLETIIKKTKDLNIQRKRGVTTKRKKDRKIDRDKKEERHKQTKKKRGNHKNERLAETIPKEKKETKTNK